MAWVVESIQKSSCRCSAAAAWEVDVEEAADSTSRVVVVAEATPSAVWEVACLAAVAEASKVVFPAASPSKREKRERPVCSSPVL